MAVQICCDMSCDAFFVEDAIMKKKNVLPRPLVQLWIPFQHFSILNEDFRFNIEKAALEWKGEDRIWLMPNIQKIHRWKNGLLSEMAIPSKSFNLISIIHINQDREIFPLNPIGLPKSWTIMPKDFINFFIASEIRYFVLKNKPTSKIIGPYITEDEDIQWATYNLSIGPGVKCKIDDAMEILNSEPFVESLGTQGSDWPSDAFNYEISDTVNIIFEIGIRVLNDLFCLGVNPDVVSNQLAMKKCLKNKDLSRIKTTSSKYISQAYSNFYKAWLLPKMLHNEVKKKKEAQDIILTELEGELKFNKHYETLNEVLKDKDLSYVLHEKEYPVIRIYTWVGYFWWELNRMAEENIDSMRTCELCGKIIFGHKNKKFCGPDYNKKCWNSRRATDKRNERKRRKEKLENSQT